MPLEFEASHGKLFDSEQRHEYHNLTVSVRWHDAAMLCGLGFLGRVLCGRRFFGGCFFAGQRRVILSDVTPSQRELDILKVLWELGSASVRQVLDRMCPKGELAFNTVQTVLRIMEDKGLVEHRSEGRTFIYTPKYSRERVTSRFLHKVFDGSLDQLVLSLLKAEDISPEELKELEQLIARQRRQKQEHGDEGPPAS